MGALTKLEAVNRILRAAGEYPTSSLTATGSNDTLMAETVLDEQTLYVNMEGAVANTIYTTMTPDTNGNIIVPDNLLHVETYSDDMSMVLSTRGSSPTYLYNVEKNTTTFTESIKVQQVVRLDFEDLPTQTQFAVTDQAARMYQMTSVGDAGQDQLLAQQEMLSNARMKQADARTRKANFMWGLESNPYNARTRLRGQASPRYGY